jgi:hypothetical protein
MHEHQKRLHNADPDASSATRSSEPRAQSAQDGEQGDHWRAWQVAVHTRGPPHPSCEQFFATNIFWPSRLHHFRAQHVALATAVEDDKTTQQRARLADQLADLDQRLQLQIAAIESGVDPRILFSSEMALDEARQQTRDDALAHIHKRSRSRSRRPRSSSDTAGSASRPSISSSSLEARSPLASRGSRRCGPQESTPTGSRRGRPAR